MFLSLVIVHDGEEKTILILKWYTGIFTGSRRKRTVSIDVLLCWAGGKQQLPSNVILIQVEFGVKLGNNVSVIPQRPSSI